MKTFLTDNFTPFGRLTEAEREFLLNNAADVHYPKGTVISDGCEDCQGMLLLKNGSLRVYMLSEDGREITLYHVQGGETCIFSASCLLSEIVFDVIITAEADTDAILVPSDTLKSLKESNIYVENFVYKLTAERFSDVMWAMQQVLFMSMDKRLAIVLYSELAQTGGDTLTMTHEQIAKKMGSAREVVTRMLNQFAKDGIVALSRGKIRILDKKRLHELQR